MILSHMPSRFTKIIAIHGSEKNENTNPSWKPQPPDHYSICFDVAVRSNGSTLAAICRTNEGFYYFCKCKLFNQLQSKHRKSNGSTVRSRGSFLLPTKEHHGRRWLSSHHSLVATSTEFRVDYRRHHKRYRTSTPKFWNMDSSKNTPFSKSMHAFHCFMGSLQQCVWKHTPNQNPTVLTGISLWEVPSPSKMKVTH